VVVQKNDCSAIGLRRAGRRKQLGPVWWVLVSEQLHCEGEEEGEKKGSGKWNAAGSYIWRPSEAHVHTNIPEHPL
jgi:hypothetical protein